MLLPITFAPRLTIVALDSAFISLLQQHVAGSAFGEPRHLVDLRQGSRDSGTSAQKEGLQVHAAHHYLPIMAALVDHCDERGQLGGVVLYLTA